MLPLRLTTADSEAERARWKVVRLDTFAVLPGAVVHADVETGNALMQVRPGAPGDLGQEEFALGPGGLRIVPR